MLTMPEPRNIQNNIYKSFNYSEIIKQAPEPEIIKLKSEIKSHNNMETLNLLNTTISDSLNLKQKLSMVINKFKGLNNDNQKRQSDK